MQNAPSTTHNPIGRSGCDLRVVSGESSTGSAVPIITVERAIAILDELLTLQATLHTTHGAVETLTAQQHGEYEPLRRGLLAARSSRDLLTAELLGLRSKFAEQQLTVQQSTKKLLDKMSKCSSGLNASRDKLNDLQKKLMTTQHDHQSLQEALHAANDQRSLVSMQIEQSTAELNALSASRRANQKELARLQLESKVGGLLVDYLTQLDSILVGRQGVLFGPRLNQNALNSIQPRLQAPLFELMQSLGSVDQLAEAVEKGDAQVVGALKEVLRQNPVSAWFALGALLSLIGLMQIARVASSSFTPEIRALNMYDAFQRDLTTAFNGLETAHNTDSVLVDVGKWLIRARVKDGKIQFDKIIHASFGQLLQLEGLPRIDQWALLTPEGGLTHQGRAVSALLVLGVCALLSVLVWNARETLTGSADQQLLLRASRAWRTLGAAIQQAVSEAGDFASTKPGRLEQNSLNVACREGWNTAVLAEAIESVSSSVVGLAQRIEEQDALCTQQENDLLALQQKHKDLLEEQSRRGLAKSLETIALNRDGFLRRRDDEQSRNSILEKHLMNYSKQFQAEDPALASLSQRIELCEGNLKQAQRQVTVFEVNADLMLNQHHREIAELQSEIAQLHDLEQELRLSQAQPLERLLKTVIEPCALNRALNRHTCIADRDLKSRVATGRFQNLMGQALSHSAAVASSFNGYAELQLAVFSCSSDAASRTEPCGENIELKLRRPLGRVTQGRTVALADTAVYSYQTRVDPTTQRERRVITHMMCKASAVQSGSGKHA